jgi:hypothetical protein
MAIPGRNEPCACGSGKKYKHCCLSKDEAAARTAAAAAAKAAVEQPPAEQPPAEGAATTAQETARTQTARPPTHATKQPWKRNETRGAPKFNIPRRSGGS